MSYEKHNSRQRSLRTLLVLIGGVLLLGCYPLMQAPQAGQPPTQETTNVVRSQAQSLPVTAQARIGQEIIDLEVARTAKEQATGLMYRQTLADNRGMLFPFAKAQQVSFWMRNVAIPLDMIFLQDGRVVEIAANVPPCNTSACPTYGPQSPVDAVIELRGGRAAELNLQVGDTVSVKTLKVTESTQSR